MINTFKLIRILEKKFVFLPTSLMIIQIDDSTYNLLIDKQNIEIYKEKYKNILDQLTPYLNLEKEYVKQYNNLQTNKKYIKGIQINTINACNLKCTYCFAGDGTHYKSNVLKNEEAKKMIDLLFKKNGDNGEVIITIIGGEPFLNIKSLKYILEYGKMKADEQGKRVSFLTTTNGTIMNKELENLIEKYNINTLLSLDSNDEETNDLLRPCKNNKSSFQLIKKKSWDYLIKNNANIHVTVTPQNLNIYTIAKNYYESGVHNICFELVITDTNHLKLTKEHIEILKEQFDLLAKYIVESISNNKYIYCHPLMDNIEAIYKRRPKLKKCDAPYDMIAFSPDSKIYPCDMLMWDEYEIGDLDSGIDSNKLDSVIAKVPKHNCKNCWGKYLCGEKCLAERVLITQEMDEIYCDFKIHIIKLQLYMYSSIMEKKPDFIIKYVNKKN